MSHTAKGDESGKALLLERVLLVYQAADAPLTGERLEQVKTLPTEFLNRLLETVKGLPQEGWDRRYAAVDDICQIYWNDLTSAAVLNKGSNGALPK